MKYFEWDEKKNEWLKQKRGVSFEEVVIAITEKRVLDILCHSNINKYPKQMIFVINIFDYAYLVPFIEEGDKVFLKTVFPSRKHTKIYIEKGDKV